MRAQNVSEKVIEKSFHSELIPIASNSLPEGMARNRRVTIHFLAHYFESVLEVQEQLQKGTKNEFHIDNTVDQVVEGEAGVRVFVPANSFVDASGASLESVSIALTESMDPLTFLAHDLQTRSSDGILETGGMIRIEAFGPDGQALSLADDAAMTIAIPDEDRQAGMEISLPQMTEVHGSRVAPC